MKYIKLETEKVEELGEKNFEALCNSLRGNKAIPIENGKPVIPKEQRSGVEFVGYNRGTLICSNKCAIVYVTGFFKEVMIPVEDINIDFKSLIGTQSFGMVRKDIGVGISKLFSRRIDQYNLRDVELLDYDYLESNGILIEAEL